MSKEQQITNYIIAWHTWTSLRDVEDFFYFLKSRKLHDKCKASIITIADYYFTQLEATKFAQPREITINIHLN